MNSKHISTLLKVTAVMMSIGAGGAYYLALMPETPAGRPRSCES